MIEGNQIDEVTEINLKNDYDSSFDIRFKLLVAARNTSATDDSQKSTFTFHEEKSVTFNDMKESLTDDKSIYWKKESIEQAVIAEINDNSSNSKNESSSEEEEEYSSVVVTLVKFSCFNIRNNLATVDCSITVNSDSYEEVVAVKFKLIGCFIRHFKSLLTVDSNGVSKFDVILDKNKIYITRLFSTKACNSGCGIYTRISNCINKNKLEYFSSIFGNRQLYSLQRKIILFYTNKKLNERVYPECGYLSDDKSMEDGCRMADELIILKDDEADITLNNLAALDEIIAAEKLITENNKSNLSTKDIINKFIIKDVEKKV